MNKSPLDEIVKQGADAIREVAKAEQEGQKTAQELIQDSQGGGCVSRAPF